MRNPMAPSGWSPFLPALDFSLLLILATLGTAGLGWLEAPAAPVIGGAQRATDANAARARDLERELADKRAEWERLQRARSERADAAAQAARQAAQERVDALEREIARRRQTGAEAAARDRTLGEEIVRTERENDELAAALARQRAGQTAKDSIAVESTPLAKLGGTHAPVYVALIDGRVTPVKEPYFNLRSVTVSRGAGRFEAVIEAVPSIEGEPIERALASGSAFSRLRDALDPSKQYLALLVDASSFESFRALRETLRRRSLPFGWEPCDATVLRLSASGGLVFEDGG